MTPFLTPASRKTGIEEVAPKVYAYIQAYGKTGMDGEEAARDIKLGVCARWREAERILPNIMRPYQEFRRELHKPLDPLHVFAPMARLREEHHHAGGPDPCCL